MKLCLSMICSILIVIYIRTLINLICNDTPINTIKNFMLIYIFSFNLYYKSFCKRFFINDNNIITAIRSNCGHYILHCKELGNTFFTSF